MERWVYINVCSNNCGLIGHLSFWLFSMGIIFLCLETLDCDESWQIPTIEIKTYLVLHILILGH